MISVKVACGHIDYTEEELEKEIADLLFFRDAFLVLLNPIATAESDIPLSRADVIELGREIYKGYNNYSKEFLDNCFSNIEKE